MTCPTIHIIDFEGNRKHGIVEYGVVTLENFEISNIHYQTNIKNFDTSPEYWLTLRRTGILCAHSAQTEDNLLRYYWASPGIVPAWTDTTTVVTWGPWIDTKMIYRALFPELPSYELKSLIIHFGLYDELLNISSMHCEPFKKEFHNALFDALAAALLLQYIHRTLPNITNKSLILLSHNNN